MSLSSFTHESEIVSESSYAPFVRGFILTAMLAVAFVAVSIAKGDTTALSGGMTGIFYDDVARPATYYLADGILDADLLGL